MKFQMLKVLCLITFMGAAVTAFGQTQGAAVPEPQARAIYEAIKMQLTLTSRWRCDSDTTLIMERSETDASRAANSFAVDARTISRFRLDPFYVHFGNCRHGGCN